MVCMCVWIGGSERGYNVPPSLPHSLRLFLTRTHTLSSVVFPVTMDSCKWLYAYWIACDTQMTPRRSSTLSAPEGALVTNRVDGATSSSLPAPPWEGAVVRNSDVAENLGQVALLMSDKTGTLTENVMVLKTCSVRCVQAGSGGRGWVGSAAEGRGGMLRLAGRAFFDVCVCLRACVRVCARARLCVCVCVSVCVYWAGSGRIYGDGSDESDESIIERDAALRKAIAGDKLSETQYGKIERNVYQLSLNCHHRRARLARHWLHARTCALQYRRGALYRLGALVPSACRGRRRPVLA